MAIISYPAIRLKTRLAILHFVGLLLLNASILLLLNDHLKMVLTDLLTPIVGLSATFFLFYTARKIRLVYPDFAVAWVYLGLGCLAWALGDATWFILEVVLKVEPFPSVADIFYLLYYPLVINGFLVIPHDKRSTRDRLIIGLDLSVVFLAIGLIYWNFLIGPLWVIEDVDVITFLISLAYPVFDLVLFAALMVLVYRKQKVLGSLAQLFLIASVGVQIVFDTIYGIQSIAGTYVSGTFLDLSWQVGFVTFGLAGLFQLKSMASPTHDPNPRKEPAVLNRMNSWLAFMPYLWLAMAYGVLIYSYQNVLPMDYQTIAIFIGGLIALILTRQIVSILDVTHISEQLTIELIERKRIQDLLNKYNNELEQTIQLRTADLTEANKQLTEEIAERQHTEKRLEGSLHEKEVLLKEVHHRVKNNLQVISSMLKLQANHVKDPGVSLALTDSQNRVQSMALIHEKLHQSANLADIDFAEYLGSLLSYLNRSYNSTHKPINLRIQTAPVSLNIDTAIPCSLIVNELFSNALKYAFPNGNGGEITVQLQAEENNRIVLTISDNGVGIPKDIDFRNSTSLGFQLVNALVGQLNGDLQFDLSQGTKFTISFTNSSPAS